MSVVLKCGERKSMPEDKFEVTPEDHIEIHAETLVLRWSKAKVGFGEIIFFTDPETGEAKCDSEMMGKEFVKGMLCLLVDKSEFIS